MHAFIAQHRQPDHRAAAWLPTPIEPPCRAARSAGWIGSSSRSSPSGARSGEDRGDLLSMLLHAQDEESGRRMTDRQLRDECMTLFLAGHETTANTLAWAWFLLSGHPEAEARLHDELDRVLDGRPPTLADLPRLPYTESVVNETLAPLSDRMDARPRGDRAARARRLSRRRGA